VESEAPATPLKKEFSKSDALRDFSAMRSSGSQKFLADRWGVSESAVSKWLASWHESGAINSQRKGKAKTAVLALPPPKRAGEQDRKKSRT